MTNSTRGSYYNFDSPVPYKKLLIHPVRVKDYFMFNQLSLCLMLEKNSVPDVKTISMTYLEYLFYADSQKNNLVLFLDGLLKLVLNKLGDKDFKIQYGVGNDARPFFIIDGEMYVSSDFDAIKEIIAEQNMLELPDETIQKEVREKMAETRRLKEKINKSKVASFEEQLLALSLFSKWDLETVYNLTVRKFILAIRRANHMIMSEIYLNGWASGTTFKDKSVLRGWLADVTMEDKNSDVLMSADALTNKVNFNEAKQK